VKNALTIDLEDYYQVSAFANSVRSDAWESYPGRLEQNTSRLLGFLDTAGHKATFFVLGWVAQKFPNIVAEIARRGHEIACHSNVHHLVYTLSPGEFRGDTQRAKELLEDASGAAVRGYRAPSFSINRTCIWAFPILAELGFAYDSSIFPIRHVSYGLPRAPRFPFVVRTGNGPIVEFPMPTLEMGGKRAPFAGGAYLRLLPYWFTRWGIRFLNAKEMRPACVYLHPWEIDAEQPRMDGDLSARLRHYLGLRGAESKLRQMLQDFEFQPLGTMIEEYRRDSPHAPFDRLPEVSFPDLGALLADGPSGESPA
jgi:polysaccharide deacetylase family protein (PEP-CTERM system associated)